MIGAGQHLMPALPKLLRDMGALKPFMQAKQPAAISSAWNRVKGVAREYGVGNGRQCPDDSEGARAFQRQTLLELRVPLSRAIVARARNMDGERLNGHRQVLDTLHIFAESGIIEEHANDLLVEAASLVLGMRPRTPPTSLSKLLRSAVTYLTVDGTPSDETVARLSHAMEHHGVTKDMLEAAATLEERAAVFEQAPYFSMEVENRLLRMAAHVKNLYEIEDRYGIPESLIVQSVEAGVIPRSAGDSVLDILYASDRLFRKEHNMWALSRGFAAVLATISLVSLGLYFLYLGGMGPREKDVMMGTTLLTGTTALGCGIKWFFSPFRTHQE